MLGLSRTLYLLYLLLCVFSYLQKGFDVLESLSYGTLHLYSYLCGIAWYCWQGSRQAGGELSCSKLFLKTSKAECLNLAWQVGFSVSSQESVVDHSLLGSIHRKTKTIVNHPQASSGFELVSKEEQICKHFHDVRFGNGLLVNLVNLCNYSITRTTSNACAK